MGAQNSKELGLKLAEKFQVSLTKALRADAQTKLKSQPQIPSILSHISYTVILIVFTFTNILNLC